MNLKEAFRFQVFLDEKMRDAESSLRQREHAYTVKRLHKRKSANPEAEDREEIVDNGEFFRNDDVLRFMLFLVEQRELLSTAITKAKASIDFDLDAAVETNKFRQRLASNVKDMLRYNPRDSKEYGSDYKFNVAGDQTRYTYEVEVHYEPNYDRENAKAVMRETLAKADQVSALIELTMVTTSVAYEPPFDVNESFEDAMEDFIAREPKEE